MANPLKTVFIGDSWGNGVQNASPAPNVYKRAIGGTTAQQWAKNTKGALSSALAVPGEAFFLSLGGNDVMGFMRDGRVTQAELMSLARNYHAVLTKLVARYGKGVVLTYRDPAFGSNPFTGFVVPQANLVIRIVAGMFPTVKEVSSEKVLTPAHFDLAKDWIHPQPSGFEAIYAEVARVVRSL